MSRCINPPNCLACKGEVPRKVASKEHRSVTVVLLRRGIVVETKVVGEDEEKGRKATCHLTENNSHALKKAMDDLYNGMIGMF